MRLILTTMAMLILFSPSLYAADKIEPKLLVGVWHLQIPADLPKESSSMKMAFLDGGRFKLDVLFGKSALVIEGKYEVDGDKLKTIIVLSGKEQVTTSLIKKLTETEFVTLDEKKKEMTFHRQKK